MTSRRAMGCSLSLVSTSMDDLWHAQYDKQHDTTRCIPLIIAEREILQNLLLRNFLRSPSFLMMDNLVLALHAKGAKKGDVEHAQWTC